MDRKLKEIMIIIWSIVAVALTSLLIFFIINGSGRGYIFNISNRNNDKGDILENQKEEKVSINNCNKIIADFNSDDISVFSTNDDELRVVHKSSSSLSKDEKISVTKEGSTILIKKGNSHVSFFVFGFSGINERIEIYIPQKYIGDLELKTASGDLKLTDSITANNIEIKTASGDIDVQEIIAKTYEINAISGDIKIQDLSGSGDVNSTSGDINIGYKDIGEYTNIKAISGDIKLSLPKDLSFQFDGQCVSGDIDSNFDMNYKNKKGNSADAKIGSEPYKKINARSTSGDINISQR